jgi:hypothetical protein
MRRHLYYYTMVDTDFENASALFGADPVRWLPLPADPTGNGYLVELLAEGALPGPLARHDVGVEVGPSSIDGERVLRSIMWRSASAAGLFPVFDGDMELISLQTGVCQLSLMGTYRPPLSVAGSAADALLGHHVAEACVRRFVLDSAERMAAAVKLGA